MAGEADGHLPSRAAAPPPSPLTTNTLKVRRRDLLTRLSRMYSTRQHMGTKLRGVGEGDAWVGTHVAGASPGGWRDFGSLRPPAEQGGLAPPPHSQGCLCHHEGHHHLQEGGGKQPSAEGALSVTDKGGMPDNTMHNAQCKSPQAAHQA